MAPIDLFEDVEEEKQCRSGERQQSNRKNDSDAFHYNEAYAQKFERQKRGEELMKLKDKYGSDYEPSESEEDFSSEDSDAEFITPEVDVAILKTLARIKKEDPKLYEQDGNVFEEEEAQNAAARAQKLKRDKTESTNRKKPMNLRDYHRKALLTNEGREFDEDEPLPENYEPTPAEEAEALRDETKRAFHSLVDDDNHDDNESTKSSDGIQDMLVLRDKEVEEIEEEDQEYQRFLIEQVGNDDIQTALQLNFGTSNDASEQTEEKRKVRHDDDEFLRAYVLGRGWIDKEAKKIPKYKELVEAGGQSKQAKSNLSGSNANVLGKTAICDEYDEEDEEFVEKAEEFETNYNFRFEDPNPTVTTHARDTGPSARRKDDSRKLGRDAVKARKDEEKRQRMEELERMKALKKDEVLKKLEIIRKNAGAEDCNLDDIDLDSDFDPESHDRRMQQVFDNDFYGKTDPDGKPVWDDDIEIDDILPDAAPVQEEINFEPGGDAYDPLAPGGKKLSKKMKRLAKAEKKRGVVQNMEPEKEEEGPDHTEEVDDLEGLSPEERKRKLLEALDEYHKLDCEDMIGDMPTRFHYTKTEATDWMTPEQILMATDAELNQVIGLKKLAPYRSTDSDRKLATRKKKLKELRKKLKTRKWGEAHSNNDNPQASTSQPVTHDQNESQQPPTKKRKGKKERQKLKEEQTASNQVADS
ncbi:hypothetical protein PGT21_009875 [Puccinia graminis f. sp. tritici]|uniref:Kri1-like C-terminal domain-containing protein n=2 Tax=Puccinia graminis f. sp. tritici TaxID=56615 RepID=E3JYS8_PUCGT|nr:uncharacterized protein PGTG_03159 [Puccinia graminis f. sp. tritici CRL 75-36-700-3]EFP77203.2 hypothetical protein PGTG_03159 [Puccinia graminis f. sp. tritici CRL 75-36-700-3]KAA1114460.1 hypothetical protein PGT21_009875 [Puccinia graminis f. sp. tritici]KAA1124257.1 hypothetical protein PGTUg99_019219 [Puccinia graminis f. sp. tritici]